MAYRNQFIIGVITGVLVSMIILGVFHHSNTQSAPFPVSHSKGMFACRVFVLSQLADIVEVMYICLRPCRTGFPLTDCNPVPAILKFLLSRTLIYVMATSDGLLCTFIL